MTDYERQTLLHEEQKGIEGDLAGIDDINVRHGFVRKVYSILGTQLVATAIIAGIVMQYCKSWGPSLSMSLLYISFFVSLGVMMVFLCCENTMRETPTNYILLSVFTVAEAVLVGFVCIQYTQESVLIALAVTSFVVVGLTIFACQTSYDITGFAPYVFVASLVFMGFSFFLMMGQFLFPGSPALSTFRLIYSCLGALLFSFYIVFDTQLIVGGKHSQYSFSLDDYCMAAINLYLDIINLFIFILEIIGKREEN
eukprot:TRINITY_DN108700_c0_g1_i1.p1 TRINITY_DN108700_c0_g1~~TRINITY_DN108700_c0_g1_i1.p1  ORF type:complete len:254 (+),score=33.26 TRINITY_DN108700_c0_g1_i1:100-861(+)